MCALFGFSAYKNIVPCKLLRKLTQSLANAAEERGTDAAGISYTHNGRIIVYKRPRAAHKIKFIVPSYAQTVMGHTRLATQGDKNNNYNNHPFLARADKKFALAHNGVLYNDDTLKKKYNLPKTKIKTDSYVAVQLIEQQKELSFDSLRFMAEKIKGSFTFTVLDEDNSLYIVKGDNPLCLLHFKELGLYVYASTKSILSKALQETGLNKDKFTMINIYDGDILKIDRFGNISSSEFFSYFNYAGLSDRYINKNISNEETEEETELLSVCKAFGFDSDDILMLLDYGYEPEDIEEMMMDNNDLLYETIQDIKMCIAGSTIA